MKITIKKHTARLMVLPMVWVLASCSSDEASVVTYAATINWTAPLLRADGMSSMSLSEIDGYKIYYGPSSGAYNGESSLISCDTSDCSTEVTGLVSKGTYYFSITAIDTDGKESTYSEVQVVI